MEYKLQGVRPLDELKGQSAQAPMAIDDANDSNCQKYECEATGASGQQEHPAMESVSQLHCSQGESEVMGLSPSVGSAASGQSALRRQGEMCRIDLNFGGDVHQSSMSPDFRKQSHQIARKNARVHGRDAVQKARDLARRRPRELAESAAELHLPSQLAPKHVCTEAALRRERREEALSMLGYFRSHPKELYHHILLNTSHAVSARLIVDWYVRCLLSLLFPVLYDMNSIPEPARDLDFTPGMTMAVEVREILKNLVHFKNWFPVAYRPSVLRDRWTLSRVGSQPMELFAADGPRERDVINQLLMIAGIEPNPGPPKCDTTTLATTTAPDPEDQVSAAPPGPAQVAAAAAKVRAGIAKDKRDAKPPRDAKIAQLVQESLSLTEDKELAQSDAMKEAISGLEEKIQDRVAEITQAFDDRVEQWGKTHSEDTKKIADLLTQNKELRSCLGVTLEGEVPPNLDYEFRLRFNGFYGATHCSFNLDDPEVVVEAYPNGLFVVRSCQFPFNRLKIPKAMIEVAARSCAFDDREKTYQNILAALSSSKDCVAAVKENPTPYLVKLKPIAFILTGIVEHWGSIKWAGDKDEWHVEQYGVSPSPEALERLPPSFKLWDDFLRLESKELAAVGAGAVILTSVKPLIPNMTPETILSGVLKRLYPDLPYRTDEMKNKITLKVTEFLDSFDAWLPSYDQNNPPSRYDLFVKACKGRPRRETDELKNGYFEFLRFDTHDGAMEFYLNQPYKSFKKREVYIEKKPPRFIMSLPLRCRGHQIAAMSVILHKIECFTRQCNVKGLNPAQIKKKLHKKFAKVGLVAETDFSSFESCIDPEMKALIENRIFNHIATEDFERDFIGQALAREEVCLVGPGFQDPHFHHIRMSGDYWTSIGNLLTNFIIMCVINEMSVEDMMRCGLFEGDDGAFPAPDNPERVCLLARDCGVLLTFAMDNYENLSFCGNCLVVGRDGELRRSRDPWKVLCNLCVCFNHRSYTPMQKVMLQRSKCLSVLCEQWIAGASAFAALFEFWSRGCRVDESFLLSRGLLKEYCGMSTESCVPDWLKSCEKLRDVVREIVNRDFAAGGHITKGDCYRAFREFSSGVCTVNFFKYTKEDPNPDSYWYVLRGTHVYAGFKASRMGTNAELNLEKDVVLPAGKHGVTVYQRYKLWWLRKFLFYAIPIVLFVLALVHACVLLPSLWPSGPANRPIIDPAAGADAVCYDSVVSSSASSSTTSASFLPPEVGLNKPTVFVFALALMSPFLSCLCCLIQCGRAVARSRASTSDADADLYKRL